MIVLKAEHCCLLLMVIMAMGTIPAGWESPVDLGLDGMHSAACINALGLACGGGYSFPVIQCIMGPWDGMWVKPSH